MKTTIINALLDGWLHNSRMRNDFLNGKNRVAAGRNGLLQELVGPKDVVLSFRVQPKKSDHASFTPPELIMNGDKLSVVTDYFFNTLKVIGSGLIHVYETGTITRFHRKLSHDIINDMRKMDSGSSKNFNSSWIQGILPLSRGVFYDRTGYLSIAISSDDYKYHLDQVSGTGVKMPVADILSNIVGDRWTQLNELLSIDSNREQLHNGIFHNVIDIIHFDDDYQVSIDFKHEFHESTYLARSIGSTANVRPVLTMMISGLDRLSLAPKRPGQVWWSMPFDGKIDTAWWNKNGLAAAVPDDEFKNDIGGLLSYFYNGTYTDRDTISYVHQVMDKAALGALLSSEGENHFLGDITPATTVVYNIDVDDDDDQVADESYSIDIDQLVNTKRLSDRGYAGPVDLVKRSEGERLRERRLKSYVNNTPNVRQSVSDLVKAGAIGLPATVLALHLIGRKKVVTVDNTTTGPISDDNKNSHVRNVNTGLFIQGKDEHVVENPKDAWLKERGF